MVTLLILIIFRGGGVFWLIFWGFSLVLFCFDNNLSHEWRFNRVASKHKSKIMVLVP